MIEEDLDPTPAVIHLLQLAPLTAEAMRPFGEIISTPAQTGDRALYTDWLGSTKATMTPRLHVNRVAMSVLPLTINILEQHPFSSQVFIPMDVARFVVLVAPTNDLGGPDLALTAGFVAPGNIGIIYAPGVWHAGAVVLDRDGSFGVLMWRNDTEDDQQFCQLDASLQLQI